MYSEEVFTFDIFVTECLHGNIKEALEYFRRHCVFDCINKYFIINDYRKINETKIMTYNEIKEMLDDINVNNDTSVFDLIIS